MNIADMFGKIQEMQRNMEETRRKLAEITVQGEAGAGMVRVTMNCARKVLKVEIEAGATDDKEMLEDLIAAATNTAIEKADERAREEMAKVTQGMLPGGIPGVDLSQFGL